MDHRRAVRRLRTAGIALAIVLVGGTVGYLMFGFGVLDALYQTVTTVATVGFREVRPFGPGEKVFTIVLIGLGVGTVLYTFTMFVEMAVEGQFRMLFERSRMDRRIAAMRGHVIVCGLGRVGRAIARDLVHGGFDVVVVDSDEPRITDFLEMLTDPPPYVLGDATLDPVLRAAGIERAGSLVAALAADADNLFVTLSGRAIAPQLFIVARAREEGSVPKLERAGADRVVNPQEIGAQRMASFIVSPNVAEFVDVVMHERDLEFRLEEFQIPASSPVAGRSLGELALAESTGALVVGLRPDGGSYVFAPGHDTVVDAGTVVIALGSDENLAALGRVVDPGGPNHSM